MNRESDVIFDPFGVTQSDQLSGAAKSKFGLLFGNNNKTTTPGEKNQLNKNTKELIETVKDELTNTNQTKKRDEIFFDNNNQEEQESLVPEVSSLDKLLRELNSLQDEDFDDLEEDQLLTEEKDSKPKEETNGTLTQPKPSDNPPHVPPPTMPRSGAPISMMEESRNFSERGEIQFIMNVSVNGRRKSLHVHSKDNALNLAHCFVKTHGLPQVKVAALAKHITSNRKRIVGLTTAQTSQKQAQRTPKPKRKLKKTSSRTSRSNTPAAKRGRHPPRSQSAKRTQAPNWKRGRCKKSSSATKKRPKSKPNRQRAHSLPRKGKKPKNVFSRLYNLAEKQAIKLENQARKKALKHLEEMRKKNTSKMSHGSKVIMKNSVNKDDTTKASERLYRHGLVQSIRREQTFRKRVKEMEMEDVDSCTFTPRITSMAKGLKREGSKIWKRIKDPMGIQMQYRKQERQEQALSKELRKCVFRPKINEGSERIAKSRMERENVVTRLSRTPRPPRRSRRSRNTPRKRRIQKSKQNELFKRLQRPKNIIEVPEDPETTFHPKINKNPNSATRTRLSEIGDYLHRKETLAFQSAQGKLEPTPTPQSPLASKKSSLLIRGILDKRFIELWAISGGDDERVCKILPEAISMDSFDHDSQDLMASVLAKLKKLNKLIDFPTFKQTLEKELEKTKHIGPNVLLRSSRRSPDIEGSEHTFSPRINRHSSDIVKKSKIGRKRLEQESQFSFSDPCVRLYYEAEKARKAAERQDSDFAVAMRKMPDHAYSNNQTEILTLETDKIISAKPNFSNWKPPRSPIPKASPAFSKAPRPDP